MSPSLRDRAARKVLEAALRRIRQGHLTVVSGTDRAEFGVHDDSGLVATIEEHSTEAWTAVLREGGVGLGLSYIEGWWDSDDLVPLIRLAIRNLPAAEQVPQVLHRYGGPVLDALARRAEDKDLDRRNIRSHYDLGNDFFSLFLDPTLTYSCGVFETATSTMEDASRAKLDRLCRKLALGPDDEVLEIGTGWGSFALHAARTYGCRVTTTTISQRQFEYASEAVKDARMDHLITVLADDYRDLHGSFDAVVSIEMIEAVNWDQYDTFFRSCARRLRPDGRMGLQAIVIADQRFERAKRRIDYIKRAIFPGGCLPSIEAIARSATAATDLRIFDIEDIGRHYAETLHRWQANFDDNIDEIRALNLGERLLRRWEFYFAYCEAAFLERQCSVVQVIMTKPAWRSAELTTRPV